MLKYSKLSLANSIEKLLVLKAFSNRHGERSISIRNVVQTHGFVVAYYGVCSPSV